MSVEACRAIFLELLQGTKPLRQMLRNGRESAAFYRALAADRQLMDEYELVQAGIAEKVFQEIVEISDRKDLDPRDKQVRINSRALYAERIKPKKFSPQQRLEVNSHHQIDLAGAMQRVNAEINAQVDVYRAMSQLGLAAPNAATLRAALEYALKNAPAQLPPAADEDVVDAEFVKVEESDGPRPHRHVAPGKQSNTPTR